VDQTRGTFLSWHRPSVHFSWFVFGHVNETRNYFTIEFLRQAIMSPFRFEIIYLPDSSHKTLCIQPMSYIKTALLRIRYANVC